MHLLRMFIATLAPATLINGLPIGDNHEQNDVSTLNGTFVSHVNVRRDVPLTARDIEEANEHGVDLNKMYKHSILKHSDGSDYSIWVHNSFDPKFVDDAQSANDTFALDKRWEPEEHTNDRMPNRFKFDDVQHTCGSSDYKKRTDKHSPFADGADAFVEWTFKNKGGWRIAPEDAYYSTDILIGGSNTGANMRFSVRKDPGRVVILGTKDIRYVTAAGSRKWRKKITGVWRMAGKGKMKCWDGIEGTNMLRWEIDRSDRDIKTETTTPVAQPAPEPTHHVEQHQAEPSTKTVYYPAPYPFSPQSEYRPEPTTKTVYYPAPYPFSPQPPYLNFPIPYRFATQPSSTPAPTPHPHTAHHAHHHVEEPSDPGSSSTYTGWHHCTRTSE
ncbi:hypothetical protein FPCIR_4587 [Fusarium pseudocircinatum]|uniref:Ecp2 effector protein domain-containing protein n=1 Tax=Fusarium pseudocircinatum TaxID=56676 RepID=A0A8H5UQZ3_9HYPO|nr:hypothetical protein FPCIR_4587 [Fusarium pseudocircinatum]